MDNILVLYTLTGEMERSAFLGAVKYVTEIYLQTPCVKPVASHSVITMK